MPAKGVEPRPHQQPAEHRQSVDGQLLGADDLVGIPLGCRLEHIADGGVFHIGGSIGKECPHLIGETTQRVAQVIWADSLPTPAPGCLQRAWVSAGKERLDL